MNEKYTQDQKQTAAEMLGFQSAELMVAYFKKKLVSGGLYEELRAKSEIK